MRRAAVFGLWSGYSNFDDGNGEPHLFQRTVSFCIWRQKLRRLWVAAIWSRRGWAAMGVCLDYHGFYVLDHSLIAWCRCQHDDMT